MLIEPKGPKRQGHGSDLVGAAYAIGECIADIIDALTVQYLSNRLLRFTGEGHQRNGSIPQAHAFGANFTARTSPQAMIEQPLIRQIHSTQRAKRERTPIGDLGPYVCLGPTGDKLR